MAIIGNLSLKNLFKKGQAMAKAVEAKVVQESGGIKTHTGGRGVNALRSNLHGTPKSHLPQTPHVQPVVGFKLKSNAWTRSKPAKKLRRGIYDLGQQIDRIRFKKEREKMLGIARWLGTEVRSSHQTGLEEMEGHEDAFHTVLNIIFVKDPSLKSASSMSIFAHELGHAIQQKTNPDFHSLLIAESEKVPTLVDNKWTRTEISIRNSLSPRELSEAEEEFFYRNPSTSLPLKRNFTAGGQAVYRHEVDAWDVAEKEFPRLAKHKDFKRRKNEGLLSYMDQRDMHRETIVDLKEKGLMRFTYMYEKGIQRGNNWFDKFMTNSRDNWEDYL